MPTRRRRVRPSAIAAGRPAVGAPPVRRSRHLVRMLPRLSSSLDRRSEGLLLPCFTPCVRSLALNARQPAAACLRRLRCRLAACVFPLPCHVCIVQQATASSRPLPPCRLLVTACTRWLHCTTATGGGQRRRNRLGEIIASREACPEETSRRCPAAPPALPRISAMHRRCRLLLGGTHCTAHSLLIHTSQQIKRSLLIHGRHMCNQSTTT